jgi:hypothetical protein
MTVDEILAACQFVKQAGTSSKVPVNITTLERICHDAKAWQSTPQVIKDAAKAVQQ